MKKKAVILCVDDEKMVLVSLRQQLKRKFERRYILETAESGEEALEIVNQLLESNIDVPVIISDHIMPGMKGDELLKRIHELSPRTLKILLTGQANADAVGYVVNYANLYRYIAKPWDQTDLNLTVAEAIRSYFQDKKLEEQNKILQEKNQELEEFNISYERFVPREFLSFLQKKSIIDVQLGDQIEKKMTVMFSDIRDFLLLSESMSPQENFTFINSYLVRMEPIIRKHHGFIDKYIGDAVMALFPTSANDAVQCSIDMLKRLTAYNKQRQINGDQPISIGIGLHTGSLMLGTVGGQSRMDSTVISDAVNLAARIESVTKTYGAPLIISEQILDELDQTNQYLFRFLGKVQVKGKKKQVSVFEIIDGYPAKVIEMKLKTRTDFEKGLFHYHEQEFAEARCHFKQILDVDAADKAAILYLKQTEHHLKYGVPKDWDGVEVLIEK
ncbi:adenylate/guanylate cyclase domain-containing protein [Chloroflexota bacterium]